MSAGCSFEGCATGLFASKNLARIFSVLHENKVFFIRHFGLPPIIDTLVRYIVFRAIKRYTAPYKRRSDPFQNRFFVDKAAVYRLENGRFKIKFATKFFKPEIDSKWYFTKKRILSFCILQFKKVDLFITEQNPLYDSPAIWHFTLKPLPVLLITPSGGFFQLL